MNTVEIEPYKNTVSIELIRKKPDIKPQSGFFFLSASQVIFVKGDGAVDI